MKCLGPVIVVSNKIIVLCLLLILGYFTLVFPSYGSSGKYLVASQAAGNNDFEQAAKNYLSILNKDDSDSLVIQEALIFSVLANDLDSAWRLSMIVEQKDFDIPSAGLVALAKSSKDGDFDKVQRLLSKYEKTLPKILTLVANGWAEIAKSNFDSGILIFTKSGGSMRYLALYNCALAFAMNGDFKNALFYLDQVERKKLQFDERQLRAQAQIYSNNGKNDKAILLLQTDNQMRNDNRFIKELRELKNGIRLKFDTFRTPSDALASVFYLMGSADANKNSNSIASIFYVQLAEFMSEEKDYYNVRLAETFTRMQAFKYSIKKYQKIPQKSMFYLKSFN